MKIPKQYFMRDLTPNSLPAPIVQLFFIHSPSKASLTTVLSKAK